MRGFIRFIALGAALSAAVACSKTETKDGDRKPSTATVAAADAAMASDAAPSANGAVQDTAAAPPSAFRSVPERFAAEAQKRPSGTVRVEDATAAFRKAGFDVKEEKQHLASIYQALYCVGAKAKGEEISFSVCEYADEAGATAGKALNDKSFAAIDNRTTYRNGGTTLTILESKKTPPNDAAVKKLVDTFAALKP